MSESTPDKVTGRWRLGGISTRDELGAWVRSGVFDAHLAGVLRMAGLTPGDLDGLVDEYGNNVANEFSYGRISFARVLELVAARRST